MEKVCAWFVKELRPKKDAQAGSSGGGVLFLVILAVIVIWLVSK